MDPLDEFHSPYTYVGNNPINLVDPDGMNSEGGTHTVSENGKPVGMATDEILVEADRNFSYHMSQHVWHGMIMPYSEFHEMLEFHKKMAEIGVVIATAVTPVAGVASSMRGVMRAIETAKTVIHTTAVTAIKEVAVTSNAASVVVKVGSGVANEGLSNAQLVQRAASFADKFVPATMNAGVTGTLKHEVATTLLKRYQNIYGYKGLNFKVREAGSILDVLDEENGVIYDWKFGVQVGKTIQQLNKLPQMI